MKSINVDKSGMNQWKKYPLGVLYVLKMNCGPIHRRRCGPLEVTISTCDNQRSSLSEASESMALSLISMRFFSNQLSNESGGWISIEVSLRKRFHWAFASTCNSIGESSFCFDAGMPVWNDFFIVKSKFSFY